MRSFAAIYQVLICALLLFPLSCYTNPPTAASIKGARTITLNYPDGTYNAEAMFVDPVTGDLFILTKASTSRIYTAPKAQLDTNDSFALTFVRTLAFNVPSGADIS